MALGMFVRAALLPLFAYLMFYHMRHAYLNGNSISKTVSGLFVGSAFFVVVSTIAALPQPTSLFLRCITVLTFHQSELFLYFAIDQLVRKEVQHFYKTKLYIATTTFSCINVILEFFRQDNLGSFIDNQTYRPETIYYLSYGMFYGIWLFVGLMIVKRIIQLLKTNTMIVYRVRDSIMLLAVLLGCFCAVLVEINLGLSIFIGDRYRTSINELYHALKAPIGFLLLSSSAPAPIMAAVAHPIKLWKVRQKARQSVLVNHLHERMIQIVPRVHLPHEHLRSLRVHIEIGDAREIIWSHYALSRAMTAKEEARLLRKLLHEKSTISTVGSHQPPMIDQELTHYNLLVAKHLKKLSTRMYRSSIPKLPALPFLGNIADFRSRRLALLRRVQQECGDVGIFQVGPWPVALLNAPDDIATVLVDQADAFEKTPLTRHYLRPLVGNGVIVSEGSAHRQRRRLMAPAFQHRRIGGYATAMVDHTEHIQSAWTNGQEIDLADAMMRLTLGIAGSTLFHRDMLKEADAISATITELAHLANDVANRLVPVPMHWPTPQNRRLRAAIDRIDTTIYRIIREHRRANQDHGDVLSMLLQVRDEADGSGLTDQDVRDELVTLVVAGHETTAMALAWTWYLLMQHPMLYQQLRDEVDHVLAGRTPTATDLAQLPYTGQVVKESLRLYAPVWSILRQATQDVALGAYFLPKGMRVLISPYVLHRNPAHFPDPERFDPDRWTPENEAKLPRYAYLPFGAGPHVCIGNHFAMMEAQLVLATLVQRVTFELVPGQRVVPEPLITLRPKGGIRVVVRRR